MGLPALGCLLVGSPAQAAGGLQIIPEPATVIILLILFLLLIYPVNQFLFRPLFRALDQRAERIAGARNRAEHLTSEADEVLQGYRRSIAAEREQAEQQRRDALDVARSEQAEIAQAARGQAEREIERARQQLASSLGEAREALRSTSDDLAREAAARILGRVLS